MIHLSGRYRRVFSCNGEAGIAPLVNACINDSLLLTVIDQSTANHYLLKALLSMGVIYKGKAFCFH